MRPPAAESPDGERPQERQTTMRGDDRRKRLTRERLIHERLIRERLIYELGMKTGVLLGAHTLAEQIGMSLPDARLRAIMEELPDEFICARRYEPPTFRRGRKCRSSLLA
jgi:hypothetical protein